MICFIIFVISFLMLIFSVTIQNGLLIVFWLMLTIVSGTVESAGNTNYPE